MLNASEQPALDLHKDYDAPSGRVWSCSPSPDMVRRLRRGRLADADHMLEIGDIIRVRPQGFRARRFGMKVTGREDRFAIVELI